MNEKINQYINELMEKSTFEIPYWNQELKLKQKPNRWNYIDGCMTSSLLNLYDVTSDSKYLTFVDSFIDYYVFDDGTIRGYDPHEYSTDDVSESKVLFRLYELTKKEKYLKAIKQTYQQILTHPRISTGNFWHKKIYHDQVWLDGLYMMLPFYVQYETLFNDKKGYSDIINQFINVRKLMFDEHKKLYYHGYDESKSLFWADQQTGLSKNFWLRAMGWYVASLSEVAALIQSNQEKHILKELLKEAIDGLLQYQDPKTHMFYQIIDRKDVKGNYLETSGSLLIAYAILKAVNDHNLNELYFEIGKSIFDGVVEHRLKETKDGFNLTGICLVAGLGPENNRRRDGSIEYYLSEPIVDNEAKGTGPLIMAYVELLRHEKKS
ncbi:MAG TPA: glycoside hydrolase family 88 protein [Acholeplasma sp.]